MSSERKDRILEATIFLLENCQDVKEVTTRAIAGNASVNPALVNYYYGSKDELMVCAMKSIMASFLSSDSIQYGSGNPKKVLEEALTSFARKIVLFRKHLKTAVPKILLDDEIVLSRMVYPLIKEYYGDRLSDQDSKLLAYQIVSFILLVFYRSDAVKKYCGVDFMDEYQCSVLVKKEVDLVLQTV
jgi:TetR/AcrR family transcriptional regulator, regulator of cefoperazone and chloramphenicol sensitivity